MFSNATSRVQASPVGELFNLLDRPEIISLGGGFPSKEALDIDGLCKATSRAIRQSSAAAFQYGPTAGFEPLKDLLIHKESSKGIAISRSDMVITSGSQQAMDLIYRVLINPSDKVIVEAPTNVGALLALRFQGAEIISVKTDEEGIDVKELTHVVERDRPKLLYLIPNFSNPTGRITSLRRRKEVLELAKKYGFYVIEDDAYGELYFYEPPPPSLLALANDEERAWVIHLSSLSTILSPGLRLAWLTAPSEVVRHVSIAKELGDTHASTLSQLVAFHYLNAGSLEPALSRMRQFYFAKAVAMSKAIKAELNENVFRCEMPEGGMYFWADLVGTDTAEMLKEAIRSGVAFVPGSAFYAANPPGNRLRLSFTSASAEQIGIGVKRLASVIKKLTD